MVKALWSQFPQLLIENINGLLEHAHPNALRAFQIYSSIKNRGLWTGSIESYANRLNAFFAKPKSERSKSQFDLFLARPMDHETYNMFHLNFRTGVVDDSHVERIASWAHNLIRLNKKSSTQIAAVSSFEILSLTLRRVTHPLPGEKASDIEFTDFCKAWRSTVRASLGKEPPSAFTELIEELHWLHWELQSRKIEKAKSAAAELSYAPGVFLTQTEIDWVIAVKSRVLSDQAPPEFPLSKGPQKQILRDLSRACELHVKSKLSVLPEIVNQRDRIRATVLAHCEDLIGEEAQEFLPREIKKRAA